MLRVIDPLICLIAVSPFFVGCKVEDPAYVGDKADKYETGPMYNYFHWEPNFHFLKYHTFEQHQLSYATDTALMHAGVVLPYESVNKEITNTEVSFGTIDDTCNIIYRLELDRNHVGRSAALSIANLFSKEENQIPQQPYEFLHTVSISGRINFKGKTAEFTYEREANHPLKGWLSCEGDTFRIQKAKNLKHGVELRKEGITYAAIDFSHEPYTIYMSTEIDEERQLLAASYLSIFARYANYLGTNPGNQRRDIYD